MVYAEVANSEASGIIYVPSSAVLQVGDKTQVFIYDEKSGTVKSRAVNVSKVNRDGTMLVDNGLKAGEKVISSGVHHIEDGEKVRLLQKPSASNVGGLL